jgi:hypothetical protein
MKEIWEQFKEWIIHKLSFHCEDCLHANDCKNCEHYLHLLEQQRIQIDKLQEYIFELNKPNVKEVEIDLSEIKPIVNNKYVPWSVKRQQLEQEDRERARNLKIQKEMAADSKKTTEQLERELGIISE